MRIIKIEKNDAGQRLDKFVMKAVKGIPVSLMYKSIRTKKIKVNRKRAEEKQMLNLGDTVQMFLAEELFSDTVTDNELFSITPKLDIVYEDDNIILCEKAPGVLVHSGDGDGKTSGEGDAADRNTLIYHIQAYLAQKGEYNPAKESSFAPALCNRIDRNTGGIVIAAKTAEALRDVNARIRENGISKFYLCAVHGLPQKRSGTLKDYLVKNSNTNTVRVVKNQIRGSKEIITKYSVMEYNKQKNLSLVNIELITGRTHQIRAHMSSIGNPLLGDGKYGSIEKDKRLGYKHQALYAYKLAFGKSEDSLSYLNGREFTVKRENIYFLREFSNKELN